MTVWERDGDEMVAEDGRRVPVEEIERLAEPEPCGHDGWRAGCPNCERQERAALVAMGERA